MQKIDWKRFGINGESKQKSFEDLCMFLCCRELKVSKIESYHNQPGIETEPFDANGKKYGFQAKFFDSKFDWKQIQKSIIKGIELYPEIDVIYIYSNKEKTKKGSKKSNPETKLEIQARKKKISLEYITEKAIMFELSKPSNLDLAQFYFGIEDTYGFIKNSVNSQILTLIQSKEYLTLPLKDHNNREIDVPSEVIKSKAKVFLIKGHPGSGKSIFMHKLLETFGGLSTKNREEMIKVLKKNEAIPMLINLKNCINESLESIIRSRKVDFSTNTEEIGFIYLFDGLDELDEKIADNVLFQICELSKKNNAKKVIISCRSGNLNRIKARTYFKILTEYNIADLNESSIGTFFLNKGDIFKQKTLNKLKKQNQIIINEIKDILLVKLLWDTVEELSKNSTILDLLEKKISLLLNDPTHKKNIEHLNLLDNKKDKIYELNKEISYKFQKEFQFRFSLHELQDIILNKYNRLDYESTNKIICYISDLFFENSYERSLNSSTSYIYQHRRYQEYFFTQKLKEEYEKNPVVIRELKIVSNREYIENFFLPYLRNKYKNENNLPGMVELNLFDVYLGNHQGFGVEDNYYRNSNEFIPALVAQKDNLFNKLIESEDFSLKNEIDINIQKLRVEFIKWEKNKDDYTSKNSLKRTWEIKIPFLIETIVLLWKSKKTDIAKKLWQKLKNAMDLYEEHNFNKRLDHLRDPLWEKLEELIYIKLKIKGEHVSKVFEDFIRYNYKNASINSKETLLHSFFNVCIEEKLQDLFKLLGSFDEYEFIAFLETLSSIKHVHNFIINKESHQKIKDFINGLPENICEKNLFILFYKKYFNIILKDNEISAVQSRTAELREDRAVFWDIHGTHINFAKASYILDLFSLHNYVTFIDDNYHYEDSLVLYAALFNDYILLLNKEKKIEEIVRDYCKYTSIYIRNTNETKFIKVAISLLLAQILSFEKDGKKLKSLINILMKGKSEVTPLSFYLELNSLIPERFPKIVKKEVIQNIETDLSNFEDDYYIYVNNLFRLSNIFARIDELKAEYFFTKALTVGVLRHGWRKDTVVSYLLNYSFSIIIENDWTDSKQMKEYAKDVFDLAMRVTEITDGRGTSEAPYLLIENISKNNIELADKFKNELILKKGHNYSNKVITSIIKAKIINGVNIYLIEEDMKEYRKDYSSDGKPKANYYEQKFIIYLEISDSYLYNEEEKRIAFEKAYSQVELIQKQGIDYYLKDDDYKKDKIRFKKLCNKYNKKFILQFDKKMKYDDDYSKKIKNRKEKQFIDEVRKSKNSKELAGKYRKLGNYKNGIELRKYRSWEVLVKKTYEINGNVSKTLDYLLKNYYPHSDFWTRNSKHFHMLLAILLKDINTKQETLEYLFENSGHGGFANIMQAYELLGDKEMCLKLFDRYLKFCKLIVN